MNDTCFGICGAFSGTSDVYEMDPACTKKCSNLIETRKRQLFGVGSCDHQVPYRPVLWQEIPRFVPRLMKDGYTPENALQKCLDLCKDNYDPVECSGKCYLDYSAIDKKASAGANVGTSQKASHEQKPRTKSTKKSMVAPGSTPTPGEKERGHKYLGILLLFLVLVLIFVAYRIYRK